MPELPEVEIIRAGLSQLIPGYKITGIKSDWQRSFQGAEADVKNFLIGAEIIAIRRRAKVLLIDLDTNYSLVIHLKMTGQLVYVSHKPQTRNKKQEIRNKSGTSKNETKNFGSRDSDLGFAETERFGAGHPTKSLVNKLPDKSTRIIFYLESGITSAHESNARKKRSAEQTVQMVHSVSTGVSDAAGDRERWRSFGLSPKAGQSDAKLFFNDQRKFGWIKLIPTPEVENLDFYKKFGPEPLGDNFRAKDFVARLRRRNKSIIKAALLDQTVIAGVGNIYADESLWGARIHPSVRVQDVSDARLKTFFKELQFVLRLSIGKGGSTDKNYINAEGKKGSYLTFARVFRRENQQCPRCKTIIEKSRVAGRGTHYCPTCQVLK